MTLFNCLHNLFSLVESDALLSYESSDFVVDPRVELVPRSWCSFCWCVFGANWVELVHERSKHRVDFRMTLQSRLPIRGSDVGRDASEVCSPVVLTTSISNEDKSWDVWISELMYFCLLFLQNVLYNLRNDEWASPKKFRIIIKQAKYISISFLNKPAFPMLCKRTWSNWRRAGLHSSLLSFLLLFFLLNVVIIGYFSWIRRTVLLFV